MNLVTNNLTQPQTIGEQTLPAGAQIVVETIDKRTRGLAERGFISIQKIEDDAFGGEAATTTAATAVDTDKTQKGSQKEKK
jgi:hypothetical protein